jgi:Tfp pilus assembly protein PilF
MEFQLENAHYFERAWLMMADYWISANNFQEAEKELRKVLKHNKSNVKAYEYMGLIKEKEKDHSMAAQHY